MLFKGKELKFSSIIVTWLLFISIWVGVFFLLPEQIGGNEEHNTGFINGNETWIAQNNTHFINTSLTINGNLTIEPGVVIEIGNLVTITVNGRLFANGTSSNPILFTASNPMNKWGWITFSSTSSGNLQHSNISHAMIGTNSQTSNVIINDSIIHNCTTGITVTSGSPKIDNNLINGTKTTTGISITGGSPKILNNTINVTGPSTNGITITGSASPHIFGNSINASGLGSISISTASTGSPHITNNTIIGSPLGIYINGGTANVNSNNITSSSDKGISIESGSANIFNNNISYANKGIYITGSVGRINNNKLFYCDYSIYSKKTNTIENCTIINSKINNFYLATPSHVVHTINTSYNNSNHIDPNCELQKQWFIHLYVKDNFGAPVQNAEITISDSETTLPKYNTDASGRKRWLVCTEKKFVGSSSPTDLTPHTIKVTANGYNTTTIHPSINISKSIEVQIQDIQLPQSSVNSPKYWHNSSYVELAYNANDNAKLKDIKLFYKYSIDNISFSTPIQTNFTNLNDKVVAGTFIYEFLNGSGYYQLYSQVTDEHDLEELLSGVDTHVGYDPEPPLFITMTSENITEDSNSTCSIEVKINDSLAGLKGPPLIYYKYDSSDPNWFESGQSMLKTRWHNNEEQEWWYFNISEPINGWEFFQNKSLVWKIICEDNVHNINETGGSEYIDFVNHAPTISISQPSLEEWYSDILKIKIIATDTADEGDPEFGITHVIAEYSRNSTDGLDGSWATCLGPHTKLDSEFQIDWDTKAIFNTDNLVWIRVQAIDKGGLSSQWVNTNFRIDNEPALTIADYDSQWHNSSFHINIYADDGAGSGIDKIYYKINNGLTLNTEENGIPKINNESANNKLEYWSVDNQSNVENHKLIDQIKLDKTKPEIVDISLSNITDSTTAGEDLYFIVKVNDTLSGIKSKPQYRVLFPDVSDKSKSIWRSMILDSGDKYISNISLPLDKEWMDYSGEKIGIEFRCSDHANNTAILFISELIETSLPLTPVIDHTPITKGYVNKTIPLTAFVTYNGNIDELLVLYKSVGSDLFEKIPMIFQGSVMKMSKKYSCELPVQSSLGILYYYISARANMTTVTLPEIDPEKNAFAMNINYSLGETQLPEWWVELYFGSIIDYISFDDPDHDGLSNLEEFQNDTDPTSVDTDNDDLPDKWEIENQLDPNDATGDNGAFGDVDRDGRSNLDEYKHDLELDDEKAGEKEVSYDLITIYLGVIVIMISIILFLIFSTYRNRKKKEEIEDEFEKDEELESVQLDEETEPEEESEMEEKLYENDLEGEEFEDDIDTEYEDEEEENAFEKSVDEGNDEKFLDFYKELIAIKKEISDYNIDELLGSDDTEEREIELDLDMFEEE